MEIQLAQLAVSPDPNRNRHTIKGVLQGAGRRQLVVFPEAMLSGYEPEREGYLKDVPSQMIEDYLFDLNTCAFESECYALVGSARYIDGYWRNAIVLLGVRDQPPTVHCKVELSRHDASHFRPGPAGEVFALEGVNLGVTACRELAFPAIWSALRDQGANAIIHLNNAIRPIDAIWKHLLIARAVENRIHVISVNNAAPPQALASYAIDNFGNIKAYIKPQAIESQSFILEIQ